MNADWQADQLERHFTLSAPERALLGNKSGATRLGFALLLKSFQLEGHFPDYAGSVPERVVQFIAAQCGVSALLLEQLDWQGRSARLHRAEVREYLGSAPFRTRDEPALVEWLAAHATDFDPSSESLKHAGLTHLRSLRVEAPGVDRLGRLVREAVRKREAQFVRESAGLLSVDTRLALDALVATDLSAGEDGLQPVLFAARSELAVLKDDAGAIKVATVIEQLEKLRQLRALGLPSAWFSGVPPTMIAQYRRRASSEAPSELRRRPIETRLTLLACLCWQRTFEITDSLVELLIHIAHRIGTHAENRVEAELLRQLRRVAGKGKLLYKLAKAARGTPDGTVEAVIYPVVPANVLDDLIRETKAEGSFECNVQLVTRNSYGHHYRRVVPLLLEALEFKSNNDRHRSVMRALELLKKHRERKSPTFPSDEDVPLEGIVQDDWHDLVLDEKENGRVNRIAFEMCVLDTLRDRVRWESWAKRSRPRFYAITCGSSRCSARFTRG